MSKLETFGNRVTQAALAYWSECLMEGHDDRRIGEIVGNPNFPRNAWCGLFAQACYRAAGLDRNLASVGKCLYGFGLGNRTSPGGKTKAFASYTDPGAEHAASRTVATMGPWVRPGDLVLHQDPKRKYNGHVMICLSVSPGHLLTIEGNAVGLLPDGTRAQGVVVRRWKLDDPYLSWVVRAAEGEVIP